ncbi:ATP-dependent DNA helicase RecQ-like [Antedon mediterranea]|uniref:ATP-dependent DNA helicase RecQ-like n=1 Tax=Antedon mediterranea TaxID=105859 RepID=UPI003AF862E9
MALTKSLNQKKLNATYIGKTGDDNDLRSGKFNIVFSSPETVLTTHRQMLLSNPYQKSIKAVFVDESHCIEKWGHTVGGESVPFREHYARIGELRSILPMSVPMIALTATASKKTRATIINDLHMKVPVLVDLGVNKPNIRYTVIKTKQGFRDVDALFSIFVPIIEELKIKKIEASRTIVFCRRRSHCRDLYEMFMTALGVEAYDATCKHVDDRGRFVAMFQQATDVDVKESVMSSFADPNGVIRVLFSTIAFGMGMDVKGLQTVIHLGPPADLDDYLQETGRAGRDSLKQSFAILLKYSHSTRRTSESMKEYISGNKCRRKTLMSFFECEPCSVVKHLCCDVCAAVCTCECACNGACNCDTKCTYNDNQLEISIKKIIHQLDARHSACFHKKVNCVSIEKTSQIRNDLYRYRNELAGGLTDDKLFTNVNISTQYSNQLIDHIIKDLPYIPNRSVFMQHFLFYSSEHAECSWDIIKSVISDSQILANDQLNSDNISSSESSTQSSESDSDNHAKHPLLNSSDDD